MNPILALLEACLVDKNKVIVYVQGHLFAGIVAKLDAQGVELQTEARQRTYILLNSIQAVTFE